MKALLGWWSVVSLQWRLTLSLLAVTGLVWSVVLSLSWIDTEHELSELLDAHLAQTAAVLVSQAGELDDDDFTLAPVLHKYQPRVAFQIWHDAQLLTRSAMAPQSPLAALGASGFSDHQLDGQSWRVFAAQGHEPHAWVLVAELQSARQDILKAGLFSALGPVLLALPILTLLIWSTVRRALAPLRLLGKNVAQRDPQALQALDGVPVVFEVQPLVQALNRLFEKVTQQMESERRFTADAAHELRTPIAAIRVQAQVARGAATEPERLAALDAVLQGCDRAARVVSQLLQMARLDADLNADLQASCDAVAETRQVLASVATRAMARQQQLSLEAPASMVVPMPAGLLGVLVGNLVDNALRYSPEGAMVQVAWRAEPVPRLVVHDSGLGLSATDLERLGDRFFRALDSGSDGSGLGWSIVRRLAQRYGLHVQADRCPQLGGLRVQVSWPVGL